MLNLDDIERKLLEANNALSTDSEGRETLRGLNLVESNFVLAVEHLASENVGAAESVTYRELRRKHLASRQLFNVRSRHEPVAAAAPALGAQHSRQSVEIDQLLKNGSCNHID